ncbi:MAG: TRAP transporter large permease [Hyphomicrobiaceae bacterium]
MTLLALGILAFILLMIVGTPLFAAIGGVAVALFITSGVVPVTLAEIMVERVISPGLIPVPFFMTAAVIMHRGGIARRLIEAAEALIGGLKGSSALVCVVATALFAAISGSSVATALAIGTILLPIMQQRGYPEGFSIGLVATSGTLGILIPPSTAMIIYGLVSETSIPRIFLAGVVPGLLQATLLALVALYFIRGMPIEAEPRPPRADLLRKLASALPALSIPGVIFVSIYGGFATVTEASALSVVAAIVVSLFCYRSITLRQIPDLMAEGIIAAAAISFIVGGALMFGQWAIHETLPQRIVAAVSQWELSGWQFLLIANVMMLILGMFFDALVITLVVVPLILPLLRAFEIDLVHFAIILIINMEIALLTPPFGLNLFTMKLISGASVSTVIRGVAPFLMAMVALLLLVTYLPAISLFLPDVAFGAR